MSQCDFFFFQAEDGIRDIGVTGVQTCALPIWFVLKLVLFLFVFVWIRATLPRFRYDQLMDLGWKRLIPVVLGWLLLLGAIRIGQDEEWFVTNDVVNAAIIVAVAVAVAFLCGVAMLVAMRSSDRHRLDEGRQLAEAS